MDEEKQPETTMTKQMKFCVDCGTEIDIRVEICPHCGIRQPELQRIKPVSDWWYALPLCFGILGGVVAWMGVRNDNPPKATNMIVVGFISCTLGWLILLLV